MPFCTSPSTAGHLKAPAPRRRPSGAPPSFPRMLIAINNHHNSSLPPPAPFHTAPHFPRVSSTSTVIKPPPHYPLAFHTSHPSSSTSTAIKPFARSVAHFSQLFLVAQQRSRPFQDPSPPPFGSPHSHGATSSSTTSIPTYGSPLLATTATTPGHPFFRLSTPPAASQMSAGLATPLDTCRVI